MTEAHQDLLTHSRELLKEQLTLENYKSRFQFLLSCEEHQMNIDIRNFDMQVQAGSKLRTHLKSEHIQIMNMS